MKMSKSYSPSEFEDRIYREWEQSGHFTPEISADKVPFTIVIPPPNITGQLHMGHALDETVQDCLIRFKRMQGYAALWLPGTDHASIATEVKIVEQMATEGLTKNDIGREAFLERAWEWKDKYGGKIIEQLKKLGCSCDWSRLAFTMDEKCSKAVVEVFVNLYNKGLIYRGDRITNWCPCCKTALSDAEVEHFEDNSFFWHIKYPLKEGGSITVATTRPETMLGDTAVAVNPKDKRYQKFIGKTIDLPLTGREIPVIADEYVDMEFGSGAVKITPAHDPNDFEVGMRHGLEVLRVMNDDGSMNALAGGYCGLNRFEARGKIVEDLKAQGLLEKTEPHKHNVGHCYRCNDVVEPIVSKQWYVKMEPLAKPAIDVVNKKKIKFIPDRFSKIYYNWMENIKDWCISRQLWWGHRIPAYYCDECGNTMVQKQAPNKCTKCGSGKIRQDEDVLDTWFSSALWPFSTLGYPDETEDLKYFYPTDVLVTAYDIIFFWVARMIFSGIEHMKRIPFKDVLIHGIVRDAEGKKMSKSLGNGIDPLEIIDKYGADTLRFSLINGISPGGDMRFMADKVEGCRNFMNKIWNASRFVLMNAEETLLEDISKVRLSPADKWILSKLNAAIREVTLNMEKYELGLACSALYDFVWSDFCDWYIEMTKPALYGDNAAAKTGAVSVLVFVLDAILKLLHPFVPFMTEEIYQSMPNKKGSLIVQDFPRYNAKLNYRKESGGFEAVMQIIKDIRTIKTDTGCPPSKKVKLYIKTDNKNLINKCKSYIYKLSGVEELFFIEDKAQLTENCVSKVAEIAEVYIPLGNLVDSEKEEARLKAELEKVEGEIARAGSKLLNHGFLDKAPKQLIDSERAKYNKYLEMKDKILSQLKDLKG